MEQMIDGIVEKLHRGAMRTPHTHRYIIAAENFLNPDLFQRQEDYVTEMIRHYRRPDVLNRVIDDLSYEDPEKKGLIMVLEFMGSTVCYAGAMVAEKIENPQMHGIAVLGAIAFGLVFINSLYSNRGRYNEIREQALDYLKNEQVVRIDLAGKSDILKRDIENYHKIPTSHPSQSNTSSYPNPNL